jgi:hypothetical protein
MNDNFAQQVAQTPSPETGSRQATQRDIERKPRGMTPRATADAERDAQMVGYGTGW